MTPLCPGIRLITPNPTELHPRTRKEHMHIRRPHDLQQSIRVSVGGREDHLLRLVAERECMRSMKSTRMPDALRATDHRRAANTKPTRLVQQPFAHGLMTVPPVALSAESQLTAVHRYARDAEADGALAPAWLT